MREYNKETIDQIMKIVEDDLLGMPAELTVYSAMTDDEIQRYLSDLINEWILRQEDSCGAVAQLIQALLTTFIDEKSLEEYRLGLRDEPTLKQSVLPVQDRSRRNRQMYLQWKELQSLGVADK